MTSPEVTRQSVPVFDATVLRDMFGAEADVIAAVLQTFMASMAASTADLQFARARGDLAALSAMAHRIRGAARMSGALALAEAAQNLEQAAKEGAIPGAQQAAAQLAGQWLLVQDDAALQAACRARRLS